MEGDGCGATEWSEALAQQNKVAQADTQPDRWRLTEERNKSDKLAEQPAGREAFVYHLKKINRPENKCWNGLAILFADEERRNTAFPVR